MKYPIEEEFKVTMAFKENDDGTWDSALDPEWELIRSNEDEHVELWDSYEEDRISLAISSGGEIMMECSAHGYQGCGECNKEIYDAMDDEKVDDWDEYESNR